MIELLKYSQNVAKRSLYDSEKTFHINSPLLIHHFKMKLTN